MAQVFRPKRVRGILLAIPVLLAGVQFVPVGRSNPAVESEVPAPENVRAILRRACYDCHSNETVWPWYSRVAPVSWLLVRDVREGRKELNFSAWNRMPAPQQVKKQKKIWEEVAEGEMPPWLYIGIHRNAALSAEDRSALRSWTLAAGSSTNPSREEKSE